MKNVIRDAEISNRSIGRYVKRETKKEKYKKRNKEGDEGGVHKEPKQK